MDTLLENMHVSSLCNLSKTNLAHSAIQLCLQYSCFVKLVLQYSKTVRAVKLISSWEED